MGCNERQVRTSQVHLQMSQTQTFLHSPQTRCKILHNQRSTRRAQPTHRLIMEHLEIPVDEKEIQMLDAIRENDFDYLSYLDEVHTILKSLSDAMEKLRDSRLMLFLRCPPCDLHFQSPCQTLISPIIFEGITCPECGNENVNVIKSLNWRAYEQQEREKRFSESNPS